MAIVKGTPVTSSQADSDAFVVTLPSFVAGDVWVAVVLTRGINTVTSPAGWTEAAELSPGTSSTDPLVTIFTRVPDGTEGATGGFTGDNPFGGPMVAVVYPMAGVDTANIFASTFSSNGATISGPIAGEPVANSGVTTDYSDSFLFNVQVANLWNATTGVAFTEPGGWTNDLQQTHPVSFDRNLYINVNYKLQPVLGASGATDGALDSTEVSDITWLSVVFALKDVDGQANQSPSVGVGSNVDTYEGLTPTLTATASDPEGQTLTYLWERLSGPAGGVVVSPDSASTQVTDLLPGTYTFRCTVTDLGSLSSSDQLDVVVQEVDYNTVYVFKDGIWERRRLWVYRSGSWS
jgi:K319-like protein